jgi:transposase-like protein
MVNVKKSHSPHLKFQVASLAISGAFTLAELSSKFGVHSSEISRWKKTLADAGPAIFSRKPDKIQLDTERELNESRLLIGRQALMLEEYKKKLGF